MHSPPPGLSCPAPPLSSSPCCYPISSLLFSFFFFCLSSYGLSHLSIWFLLFRNSPKIVIATGVRSYFSLRRRRPPCSTFLQFTRTDTLISLLLSRSHLRTNDFYVSSLSCRYPFAPPNRLNQPSGTACVSFGSPNLLSSRRPSSIHQSVRLINGFDRALTSRIR